jgi:hypothetical protein
LYRAGLREQLAHPGFEPVLLLRLVLRVEQRLLPGTRSGLRRLTRNDEHAQPEYALRTQARQRAARTMRKGAS